MDDVIECPNCGTKNRVREYDKNLRPICGKCHLTLETAIESYKIKNVTTNNGFIKKRSKSFFGGITVFLLFLIIISYFAIKHKQSLFPNESFVEEAKQSELGNSGAAKATDKIISTQDPAQSNKKTVNEQKEIKLPELNYAKPIKPKSPEQYPIEDNDKTQIPKINNRLANGKIIYRANTNGLGELTVKNGLSSDAVAKLIDQQTEMCKAFFYISAGNQFTLTSIDDGHYRLIFGTGDDWDQGTEFFRYNKAFFEFEKPMVFKTIEELNYTRWTKNTVTLHGVIHGNIRTNHITEEEFKKYRKGILKVIN